MMEAARKKFHEELHDLEDEIVRESALAVAAMKRAVEALVRRDPAAADAVIEGDDRIDELYLNIERRILELLARQTPVATDLRLISAIMHINLHLERVGDMAVNIAKISKATQDLPGNETVTAHLQEMAGIAAEMMTTATRALVQRDMALCLTLPQMDDPIDDLNRGMYREVVGLAADPRTLEWGVQMHMVSRQLERVGDHAVDIGEQVGFLLTGEFREFTDASHPDEQS